MTAKEKEMVVMGEIMANTRTGETTIPNKRKEKESERLHCLLSWESEGITVISYYTQYTKVHVISFYTQYTKVITVYFNYYTDLQKDDPVSTWNGKETAQQH